MATAITSQQQQLKSLAEGLLYIERDLSEWSGAEPKQIRQEREYQRIDRNGSPLARFIHERGVVPVLSNDDMLELFYEIHVGAQEVRARAEETYDSEKAVKSALTDVRRWISRIEAAEEELFIANRRLIVSCVKPYQWVGPVWVADFLQEGSKALTKAIRKFDFTRGIPFYSYSKTSIQNRLRNYFRDHTRSGTIGVRPTREMSLIKNALDEWSKENEGEPDQDVLAKMSGLTPERVRKLLPFIKQWKNAPPQSLSLDAMMGETGAQLYDFLEDEGANRAFEGAQHAEILEAIEHLPPRSRLILRLRFIDGETLEVVGQQLSLTRARIKQIQDAALLKLRHMLSDDEEE